MEFIQALDPGLITKSINSPVYLNLGGALAAIGLIFAVYQLRKPQWDVVLRIRKSWQRNLFWILGGIGLLLTLIRVLLINIQMHVGPLSWPFNSVLFYEIAAYLFFIASPLSLVYFSSRTKGLFTEYTARKFYEVMIQEISTSNNDRINAALEVFLHNFRNICEATHEHKQDEKLNQFARASLDVILSDESIVKILTTKRLDALQFIFAIVEAKTISQRESGVGIPRIVQNLFYDKDSFFYKQLDRDGLALSSNIYRSIFDSSIVLTNFDLFGYPTLGHSMIREISLDGVEVFIESLSCAIKTYLKTGDIPPRHINNGLSHLSQIFGALCLKINAEEKRGVDTKYNLKDDWRSLYRIANFLGHDYQFLTNQEPLNQTVIDREKTTSEADFYSNLTINAGIAGALYKAFEQLSYIERKTDIYDTVLDLLNGMIYEGNLKEGYRRPFEKRMWEQIGRNVIGKHYPAPLRTYLVFIGYCLASDKNQGWIGEQTERMRRLLYIDLKPLIDKDVEMVNNEKMQNALLPQSMDYKDGKFIYKFKLSRGKENLIDPPPEGSTSALAGVDLKNRSLF